jgi:hypothetical protein
MRQLLGPSISKTQKFAGVVDFASNRRVWGQTTGDGMMRYRRKIWYSLPHDGKSQGADESVGLPSMVDNFQQDDLAAQRSEIPLDLEGSVVVVGRSMLPDLVVPP